ncbi:hypothetical protein [Flavobacterium sp.]|uniref:hypothetical protein n=1 Tax=Flavobacterium sp. TaxID=239 RepID=UPI0026279182|nr:hypothetical protein [Flavobacterium sp.]MDD2985482.1 hypothetical protein [Flavobacterium sp.]
MTKKIVFSIFIIFCISCRKDVEVTQKSAYQDIKFIFPDTVYVNESYDGKISFKSNFDTITTSLSDYQKARFLEYSFWLTKKPIEDNKLLKKMVTDTFVAETNRLIPLYDIKFDKLGLHYFNGIIKDEIIIAKGGVLKDGSKGDRIITNEIRLTRAVYVIDNRDDTSVKSSYEKR